MPFFLFSLRGLSLVSFGGFGIVSLAIASPLLREDNHRSKFAGNEMERVGAFPGYEQTASAAEGQENSGTGSETRSIRTHDFSKSAGVGNRAVAAQSAHSSQAVGRAQKMLPAQVYKNAPLQSVFLNGENVVGLRNQTLHGVTVRFDAHGNISIDAPHYEIEYDTSFHPLLPEELPQMQKQRSALPQP